HLFLLTPPDFLMQAIEKEKKMSYQRKNNIRQTYFAIVDIKRILRGAIPLKEICSVANLSRNQVVDAIDFLESKKLIDIKRSEGGASFFRLRKKNREGFNDPELSFLFEF